MSKNRTFGGGDGQGNCFGKNQFKTKAVEWKCTNRYSIETLAGKESGSPKGGQLLYREKRSAVNLPSP
jgi:hypothetical protein